MTQEGHYTCNNSFEGCAYRHIHVNEEKYKKVNYSSSAAEGYRVQISTDAGNNAKDISNKVLQEFKSAFSDVSAYIIYQQPNFKVRCGDFRYKSEARKLQKRIASMYPSTFIVKDEIN